VTYGGGSATSGGVIVGDSTMTQCDAIRGGGTSAYVQLGNGDGTLKAGIAYNLVNSTSYLNAIDLTGDGIVDLVTTELRREIFLFYKEL